MSITATAVANGLGGQFAVATWTDGAGSIHEIPILAFQVNSSTDPAPVTAINPLPVTAVITSLNGTLANVQGNVAVGGAATGNPLYLGAVNSGNMKALTADASGNLNVDIQAGAIPAEVDNSSGFTSGSTQGLAFMCGYNDSIATPSSGNLAVPRISVNRQLRTVIDACANGGWTLDTLIAPTTPAVHTIKSAAGQIGFIHAVNLSSAIVYIKFFDQSGAVTLGVTAASSQVAIPFNTQGAGFVLSVPAGLNFVNKVQFAVTQGISATDNTSVGTANAVLITTGWL